LLGLRARVAQFCQLQIEKALTPFVRVAIKCVDLVHFFRRQIDTNAPLLTKFTESVKKSSKGLQQIIPYR